MSSARGAAGAVKPKLHNVNSIYAGKNQSAVKAPGVGKHGGLQSLGKTTAVVRRMPPPATLPSLRAESQGQDPNVALVPQGGTGWARGDSSTANGQTADLQSTVKSPAILTGSTPATTTLSTLGGVNSGSGPHTADLRPTWAKQSSVVEAQATALQNSNTVTASSRDFPSLAAATAAIAKQSSNVLTESLKPQKSGSWRAGGSSVVSRNEGDVPQVTHSGSSYLSATVIARVAERQLPSRYYDTTAVPPPPPPNGTFQVPKLQPAVSVSSAGGLETLSNQSPVENAPARKTSYPGTTNVSSVPPQYAVPPPNYCRPPPNYVATQTDTVRSVPDYGAQWQPSEDVTDGKQVEPKSGLGDEGCGNRRYLERTKDGVILENAHITISSDIQLNSGRDDRGVNFDEFASGSKSEWLTVTYGSKDDETHRWLNAFGCTGSEPQHCAPEFTQNGYPRDRDEELGRRQNIEREAAIERSRQKRRMASQSSALSESEGGSVPSGYGSVRMMNAYENDSYTEWDQPVRGSCGLQKSDDDSVERVGECWSGHGISTRRDEQETRQRIEFRMLKRPETKGDVVQQLSQLGVQNNDTNDGDEELQLTKLSRPAAKIVKRMAPGSMSAIEGVTSGSSETVNSQTQRKPTQQQKNIDKKALFHREIDGSPSSEWGSQKQKISLSSTSQQSHTIPKTRENRVDTVHVTDTQPPADNVWEKRAEERESAEKERVTQQNALDQMRLQQQYPTVGEQLGISANEPPDENSSVGRSENSYSKSEQCQRSRRTGNRSRNRDARKWAEKKYNYSQQIDEVCLPDYYVAEEEEDRDGETAGLFHGQREFVNSKVHRPGRGSSLVNSRGSRSYGSGSSGIRRGGSISHQHLSTGQARIQNRSGRNQRRGKCQEPQEDNFSNMGEFRVEDTYVNAPTAKETQAEEEKEESKVSGPVVVVQDLKHRMQIRNITRQGGSHRSSQQLYEPKKRQEYSRMARRGARVSSTKINPQRTSDVRTTGSFQNPPERGKRKKVNEAHRMIDDESSSRAHGGSCKRGGIRGANNLRRQRHSGVRQDSGHGPNQLSSGVAECVAQLKSPVTSEGHEEWETASESSDFADRQKQVRHQNAPSKCSNSRRTIRSSNGRREPATGAVPNRTSNNSKNVKPASTTSHVATRGAQLAKEETAPLTQGEATRRPDTCRDGLAGVDINNAGVIVIDDRPDGQVDDGMENDDFEEVLSKKNRKLRQQQINEQLEAEERRKIKEKEKMERRKARVQAKRVGKKSATKIDRIGPNSSSLANDVATKTSVMNISNQGVGDNDNVMSRPVLTNTQNALNTTVWNSSIVHEQSTHPSSPVENLPVIPSPIARPTPKVSISSASIISTAVKNEVDIWTGVEGEQRFHTARKFSDGSKKNSSAEFTSNFNSTPATRGESGQYQFTFDPSLQDNTPNMKVSSKETLATKRDDASPLANVALEANDDECLKQRLDKVKDFWPGQQQFANNLLGNGSESTAITPLVADKSVSANVGVSSVAHGPNVAKVRPQPQASEQAASVTANFKEANSSTPFVPLLPPPSPIACLPPGAYLQSLTQVPPPAPFPHYSVMFSEPYNPNSSTSAQTLISNGVPGSQTQTTRSRPGSFMEQSQLFIHPPPSGAAGNSMTWSSASPQVELLTGINTINAAPPPASQPVNSVQRFQVSSPRSASAFGPVPSVLGSNAKIPHMGRPPPHPHQVPPPLHPPHNFMAPPPDFLPLQSTGLSAIGGQRSVETQNTANNPSSRNANTVGQIPHLQQTSQTGYSMSASTTFNQAPQFHAFTAPPPPIRYPAIAQMASNDANGVLTAGWPRAPALSFKYTNSVVPANRPALSHYQSLDRWTVPVSLPVQYHGPQNYQHQTANKDGSDTVIHGNIDRFQGTHMTTTRGPTPEESSVRASSVSTIPASGTTTEPLDNSNRQKATKV